MLDAIEEIAHVTAKKPSCQPNDDSPGSACSTLKLQTANAGGGCACSVEGGSNAGSLFASGGALLAFALIARRRRGRGPRGA